MRVISNATDNQTSDAENRAEQVCCTSETDMLHFGTYYARLFRRNGPDGVLCVGVTYTASRRTYTHEQDKRKLPRGAVFDSGSSF